MCGYAASGYTSRSAARNLVAAGSFDALVLVPRRRHDSGGFRECLGCGGFERPLPDVLVQDLDSHRTVVTLRPDCVQKCGNVELAVTGQKALVDHGVLEIHGRGERYVVDLDTERNVAPDPGDVLRLGAGALQMEV